MLATSPRDSRFWNLERESEVRVVGTRKTN